MKNKFHGINYGIYLNISFTSSKAPSLETLYLKKITLQAKQITKKTSVLPRNGPASALAVCRRKIEFPLFNVQQLFPLQ